MLKKILILFLASFAALLSAFFLPWRLKFLEGHLLHTLEGITGQPVSFSKALYKPINRISIENLKIGDSISASVVTVYLDPLKYISTLNPLDALRKVVIYSPDIKLPLSSPMTVSSSSVTAITAAPTGIVMPKELILFWNNGTLVYGGNKISGFGGEMFVKNGINAKIFGKSLGGAISCNIHSSDAALPGKFTVLASYVNPCTDIKMRIFAKLTSSKDFDATYDIQKLKIKDFEVFNSSGYFRYNSDNLACVFNSSIGQLQLAGRDFNNFRASATFDLSGMSNAYRGNVAFNYVSIDSNVLVNLNTSALIIQGMAINNINVRAVKAQDGEWNIKGNAVTYKYSFSGKVTKGLDTNIDFRDGRAGTGNISGSFKPLSLHVQARDWNIEKAPVVESYYKGIKGEFSLDGYILPKGTNIKIDISKLIYGTMPADSIALNLINKENSWFLDAISSSKGWVIKAKYETPYFWEVSVALAKCEIKNVSQWFSDKHSVSGNVTGQMFYSSAGNGGAKLDAVGLVYDNSLFGDAKVNVSVNNTRANIEKVILYSGSGKVNLWGYIGLSDEDSETLLTIRANKFYLAGSLFDGKLVFSGKAHKNRGLEFGGSITSDDFRFGKWSTNKVNAYMKLLKTKLSLENFEWDSAIKGNLEINIPHMTVLGNFIFKNIPLQNIEPELIGIAAGVLQINGHLANPNVEINYAAPGTVFRSLRFDQTGKVQYFNGKVSLKDVNVTYGKSTAKANGLLVPVVDVRATFADMPTHVAQKIFFIKKEFTGLMTGNLRIRANNTNTPDFFMEAHGKNDGYDGTTVSDLKFKAMLVNGKLTVDYILAKFADSELRLLAGSIIDFNKSIYNIKAQCRNVHIGPFDILGEASIVGAYLSKPGAKTMLSADVSTKSLWVNQYNLTDFKTSVKYSNGVFTFIPMEKNELNISGVLNLNYLPLVKFDHLKLITGSGRECSIDGEVGEKKWDFIAIGKNMDIFATAELFGLTVPCEGSMNVNFTGKGTTERPEIEAAVDMSNGSISEIPFDNINLQLSSHHDVMTVVKAKLAKKNLFSITVSGFSPFALTDTGIKRIHNNPIDISVTVEEGTLSMLKVFSNDIIGAKGSFRALAHMTGIVSKPVLNGLFKCNGGEIDSKRYFTKLINLNADILMRNNLLTIKELSGKIGEGLTRIKGKLFFSGVEPKKYDLEWLTEGSRGIPIFVPELPIPSPLFKSEDWYLLSNLSQGQPRFDVKFTGSTDSPLLSGWVDMENTHFTFPSLAKPSGAESILDDLWPIMRWDLEIRADKNTWYDNDLVSANITGSIKLSGKGLPPVVTGHIESSKGSIVYIGTEFDVKYAAIDIANNHVFIEGQAETDVYSNTGNTIDDNDTIQLIIDKAEITKIKPRFASKNNPNLAPEKAMARATGINPDSTNSSDTSFFLRKSILRFVDSTLTTPLAKNILGKSGLVDSFKVQYVNQDAVIKPQNPDNPSIADFLAGTKYSFEKYINNKMAFGYSMIFDELNNKLSLFHELGLSFNLNKGLFLKGTYDLDSDNPLHQNDRRIELQQQWRFGASKKKKTTSITQ